MNIFIMSRLEIENMIKTGVATDACVIGFRDVKDDRNINYGELFKSIFTVVVDDLEYDELEETGLTYEKYFSEAKELAQFIHKVVLDDTDIICQCEYGQGRSAACAAAVLEVLYGTGISVFSDYRYYPNKIIYNKLVVELTKILKKV